MADRKISELTNITGANVDDANDEIAIVDTSASETKAITRAELFKDIDGNITLSGTVDGRDVAADGSKLDGIETNADVTDTANVTAAGALMDSELTSEASVKALDQGVATTDSPDFAGLTVDEATLTAIAETKADTAVDVFVYDTSKDSDGGAWRKRTQHTSWYNETLNTATRGSRREFPAVAVIVAESNQVTIYDGDDPALPMWMVFNSNARYFPGTFAVSSVSAVNGEVSCGGNSTFDGLSVIRFLSDSGQNYRAANNDIVINGGISGRNDSVSIVTKASGSIINEIINDVAMTVLPDAPIDPATGIQRVTIACATDGGVSVIRDNGTVVDSATPNTTTSVSVYGEDMFFVITSSNNPYQWVSGIGDLSDGFSTTFLSDFDTSGNYPAYGASASNEISLVNTTTITGGSLGLFQATIGEAVAAGKRTGMSALLTSTYNTGWMNGDIKGAFLSDTDDTDLVGGTDADRSVNGNDLTVNGTVTRSPVATGADLVAYSGFSASNYLEQPYNPDLDFGTGDFCVMGWFNTLAPAGATDWLFDLADEIEIAINVNSLFFNCGIDDAISTPAPPVGLWGFVSALRRSGTIYIYLNGEEVASGANNNDVSHTGSLILGNRGADLATRPYAGSLALWRISATAPTAEQISRIYNDEKHLFTENAACTIAGTSDAVTALAHDDSTGLLHVGSSDGRSVFQGLRRVDNTTDAVSTAISASNNLIVEQ